MLSCIVGVLLCGASHASIVIPGKLSYAPPAHAVAYYWGPPVLQPAFIRHG